MRLVAPDGSTFTVGPYTVRSPEPLTVTLDLAAAMGRDVPPGPWTIQATDSPARGQVLATETFQLVAAVNRRSLASGWETRVPSPLTAPLDCFRNRVVVELAVRRVEPEPSQRVSVYAAITAPTGRTVVLRPLDVDPGAWASVRIALCSVVTEPAALVGTWTVEWFQVEASQEPIARATFRVTPPTASHTGLGPAPSPSLSPSPSALPTATPMPSPPPRPTPTATPQPTSRIELMVPEIQVEVYDCDAATDIRVRNANGRPGQSLSVLVEVVPPGQAPRTLDVLTLTADEWTGTGLHYCQVAGGSQISGTWVVRVVDAMTGRQLLAQASFEVRSRLAESDTDNDGVADDVEADFGTDPSNPDTDGDTLLDGEELYVIGTDPRKVDTDWDGFTDAQESMSGSDPWEPCDPDPASPACLQ